MLMIRLARFGTKKRPTYRVVVIDKERARDSKAIEVVGIYNPVVRPKQIKLEHERIAHWMKFGAQPSDTVKRLMKNNPAEVVAQTGTIGRAETMASVKSLVEEIAKALVDAPDEVSVREIEGEQVTVLELKVAAADVGKVIGKQGRTARSIRTLLGAAGMKLDRRINLEILE
jgi:ribosomal protein S16